MEFKEYKNTKEPNKINLYSTPILATFFILLAIGIYLGYRMQVIKNSTDFGTYKDPEKAFEATQKALFLLSTQVNVGIESVEHIEEYEIAKNKIFRTTKNNLNDTK